MTPRYWTFYWASFLFYHIVYLFDGFKVTVPFAIPLKLGTSLLAADFAQSGRIPVYVLSQIPVLDLDLWNNQKPYSTNLRSPHVNVKVCWLAMIAALQRLIKSTPSTWNESNPTQLMSTHVHSTARSTDGCMLACV